MIWELNKEVGTLLDTIFSIQCLNMQERSSRSQEYILGFSRENNTNSFSLTGSPKVVVKQSLGLH